MTSSHPQGLWKETDHGAARQASRHLHCVVVGTEPTEMCGVLNAVQSKSKIIAGNLTKETFVYSRAQCLTKSLSEESKDVLMAGGSPCV